MDDDTGKPGFFERLFNRMASDAPESAEEIVRLLQLAHDNDVVDADTAALLEKVLAFAELEVRDVMITRSQMDVIKIDDPTNKIVDYVLDTAHSRLPVIGNDRDEVLGVLHAKDLLRYFRQPENLDIKKVMREAVFVPESKSLNTLIKEFRAKRIHLAMVVDEYGGISGLVTFEDILEAIIGDIEDEFDEEEEHSIVPIDNERYRVNAVTEVSEFNKFFNTDFSDEDVDTVGGLVISELGRLPERGEKITLGDWQFTVARADHRRLHVLIVSKTI
ncbi:MAG: transporter associated domain-containing protein [Neisseria sp.]|nr:transporter associated domain-containing protein [Neisseria sp.]